MSLASYDVQNMLDADGLGLNISVGSEPTDPDDCITLYDINGGEQNPKFALDVTKIQVRSRGVDYDAAHNQLRAVKLALEGRPSSTFNGTEYIGFYVESSMAFLMMDERNRTIFTMTVRITRELMGTDAGHRQPTSS